MHSLRALHADSFPGLCTVLLPGVLLYLSLLLFVLPGQEFAGQEFTNHSITLQSMPGSQALADVATDASLLTSQEQLRPLRRAVEATQVSGPDDVLELLFAALLPLVLASAAVFWLFAGSPLSLHPVTVHPGAPRAPPVVLPHGRSAR